MTSRSSVEEARRFELDVETGALVPRAAEVEMSVEETDRRRNQVIDLLGKLATLLANRAAANATHPPWAIMKPFGSTAIGGNLNDADLDMYVTPSSHGMRFTASVAGRRSRSAMQKGLVALPPVCLTNRGCLCFDFVTSVL